MTNINPIQTFRVEKGFLDHSGDVRKIQAKFQLYPKLPKSQRKQIERIEK